MSQLTGSHLSTVSVHVLNDELLQRDKMKGIEPTTLHRVALDEAILYGISIRVTDQPSCRISNLGIESYSFFI